MDEPIETTNKFGIAVQGDMIVILFPLPLSHDDALLVAAYLVALSEKPFERFQKVYKAVCST